MATKLDNKLKLESVLDEDAGGYSRICRLDNGLSLDNTLDKVGSLMAPLRRSDGA